MQDTATATATRTGENAPGPQVGNAVPLVETGVIPAIQITVFDDANQVVRQEQHPVQDFFPSS